MVSPLRTPSNASTLDARLFDSEIGFFSRWSATDSVDEIVARRASSLVTERALRARTREWRDALTRVDSPAIALIATDGVEFAAAMVGAFHCGKTVYLPGDTRDLTCSTLRESGVVLVGEFDDKWNPLRAPLRVVTTAPSSSTPPHQEFERLDADRLQLVIYTSGSSGAPQALPKRLSQLLAEVSALESVFGERIGSSEVFATVSHQHIYGLLFKILLPLATRRTFVSVGAEYPEEIVAQCIARATTIISGPAHLKRLPTNLDWHRAQPNVCAVFSSGGPLTLDNAVTVESIMGSAPIEVYGSSESGGVAWRRRSQGIDRAWTPLPGVQVKTTADERIAVQSRHLPDSEWFTLADRAVFDASGHFTLHGRTDRIAKIEGKRISLAGIEETLLNSGLVADVRVVQLATVRDELGAVVVPTADGWALMRAESPDALRALLQHTVAETTERIAHPRRWRWLDALPVNAVGKTTLDSLAHLFQPRALHVPAAHELSRDESHVALELYVSPHLQCFDGHFATLPVLPGVAQLDWAVLFARSVFPITGEFERMEALKFQRLYRPQLLLSLELEWHADRKMLTFRYVSSEGPHSNGRIFFTR